MIETDKKTEVDSDEAEVGEGGESNLSRKNKLYNHIFTMIYLSSLRMASQTEHYFSYYSEKYFSKKE